MVLPSRPKPLSALFCMILENAVILNSYAAVNFICKDEINRFMSLHGRFANLNPIAIIIHKLVSQYKNDNDISFLLMHQA